jgi:NTP pyrophosphatase (non-canonical NTP hydrolase)
MDFSEYQDRAASTAIYPSRGNNLAYVTLGLVGEAGEIANKVKKIWRDHGGVITSEMRYDIACELGDVLWYISQCCSELDYKLEDIAAANLAKLANRANAGTLNGNSDDR